MNIGYIRQRNSLRPEERLKLRKQIEMLFQRGEAFSFYPLRVVFRFVEANPQEQIWPVKVGFSVPKKRFRHAHDRNRIRRLLKEAWRQQKHPLYESMPAGWQLHCFLIYNGREILTFEQATEAVRIVQQKLIQKISTLQEQERP